MSGVNCDLDAMLQNSTWCVGVCLLLHAQQHKAQYLRAWCVSHMLVTWPTAWHVSHVDSIQRSTAGVC